MVDRQKTGEKKGVKSRTCGLLTVFIKKKKKLTSRGDCATINIPRMGFIFLCPFFGSCPVRGRQKLFRSKQEVPIMRVKITLACTECKQRNYDTVKNKKNDPDRLEMTKYCRFCRKHTTHKETK